MQGLLCEQISGSKSWRKGPLPSQSLSQALSPSLRALQGRASRPPPRFFTELFRASQPASQAPRPRTSQASRCRASQPSRLPTIFQKVSGHLQELLKNWLLGLLRTLSGSQELQHTQMKRCCIGLGGLLPGQRGVGDCVRWPSTFRSWQHVACSHALEGSSTPDHHSLHGNITANTLNPKP